ncbi:MAG TPA: hypothetical protein VD815_00980 [Candidatus Saccharimonadales bacterium]|nr:hypothetical protein [Candidatus Saccharimonadales bacterium]
MAINISSAQITHSTEKEVDASYQNAKIDECVHLLRQLDRGIYTIFLQDTFPASKSRRKYNKGRKLEVKVDYLIEYGKFIYLRKPYVTKQIKIGGKDISCLKSWHTQQIVELCHKLIQYTSVASNPGRK